MRTINAQRLKELIRSQGEAGKARVAIGARVGLSTLEKMCAGTYGRVPRQALRERLSAYFKVSEDELFPLVGASGKQRKAS